MNILVWGMMMTAFSAIIFLMGVVKIVIVAKYGPLSKRNTMTKLNLFETVKKPLPPATAGEIAYVCAVALGFTIVMATVAILAVMMLPA